MTSPKDDGPSSADLEASESAFESARADAQAKGDKDLPAIDFTTFVLSLSHSALVHLGDAPDPSGGQRQTDLAMARQTIDLIALLQDKSRGNLNGSEESVMARVLFELRMRYVEIAKKA